MKAVVLCAGLGTRLASLTRDCPKPMLPVAGRPLLEYTLRHLARHGVRQVAINLHHHPEMVRAHVGDGAWLGLEVSYFHEPVLLGTAGALTQMAAFLDGDGPFLVQYGDVVTDHDLTALVALHRRSRADATLLLHQRPESNSVVALAEDGRVVEFVERPSPEERARASGLWVNSGVCVAGRAFLSAIPDRAPADIPRDVIVPSLHRLRVYGQALAGYRCAVDSPSRYAALTAAITEGRLFGGDTLLQRRAVALRAGTRRMAG